MILYANHTRTNAIVTIKVGQGGNLDKGVKIGPLGAAAVQKVLIGYNDVLVPAETAIELEDGLDVTFIGVRT
ncbi:MAG: hypothetical protein JNL82_29670 [Myxococcales bacterium]|nr:hypothetical protein [Myxococcales bacterium]